MAVSWSASTSSDWRMARSGQFDHALAARGPAASAATASRPGIFPTGCATASAAIAFAQRSFLRHRVASSPAVQPPTGPAAPRRRMALMQPGQFRGSAPGRRPFTPGSAPSARSNPGAGIMEARTPVGGRRAAWRAPRPGRSRSTAPGRQPPQRRPARVVLPGHLEPRYPAQPVDGLPAVGRNGLGRQPRDLVRTHTAAVPSSSPLATGS